MIRFYGISTIVGYLMPNIIYAHILNRYNLVWLVFGISTIVGYLRPNPHYKYISNIYDMEKCVWKAKKRGPGNGKFVDGWRFVKAVSIQIWKSNGWERGREGVGEENKPNCY